MAKVEKKHVTDAFDRIWAIPIVKAKRLSLIMMHKLKIVEEITHKEMSSSVGRQTHTMLEVMRFGRKE